MPSPHTQNECAHLLVALLEALEASPSAPRTRTIEQLRSRLLRCAASMEQLLPLGDDRTFIVERGITYSVLRVVLYGEQRSVRTQRRAVIRMIRLLQEADEMRITLPRSPMLHVASIVGASVGRFSDRHPILVTIIVLALILVTIWRESFQLTTKFGSTEITISGQHTPPSDRSFPALPERFGPEIP